MDFYLASSFKYAPRVQSLYNDLIHSGHFVPDVWWHIDSKDETMTNSEWYQSSETKSITARHWKSINQCDALILVGGIDSPSIFNGALVEVGYALGNNIPVFSVGHIKKSAMLSQVIHCYTIDELLRAIDILDLARR